MRRLLVFLLEVIFSQLLLAQQCQLEADISSFENRLNIHKNHSDSYLMDLNRLSILYIKQGNIDKADSINKLVIKSLLPDFSVSNPVVCGALDIRGLIYFALNDIEEAQRLWTLSLALKQHFFPRKKGWLAESYSYIARCYNYLIDIDSAIIYSEKAVALLNQCSKAERLTINAPEILRTFIYAYKISNMRGNEKVVCLQVAEKLDSISKIPHPWLNYYLPDYVHDKANVFTDLALHYRNIPTNKFRDPAFSEYCYHKAQRFYNEELSLRQTFNDNPNSLSVLYFTKALVQQYTFGNSVENMLKCLEYSNASIQQLDERMTSGKIEQMFFRTGKLNVMMFKSEFLINLYCLENNRKYLYELNNNASEAYDVFITLINSFKSDNIGSVFEIYNLFQFDALIYSELELYKLTGDKKFLNAAFSHSQQSRFLDLLSDQKNRSLINFNKEYFNDVIRKNIFFTRFTSNVFLDYYSSDFVPCAVFVVSKGELHVCYLDKPDFSTLSVLHDPAYINQKSDTVSRVLNSFYNCLIKPVEGYIQGKKTIHISSKSEFSAVPFDALVADLSNPNHFLGDDYCIQNRFSLLINPLYKSTNQNDPVSLFTLNPQYITHPDLLFHNKLCDELNEKYKAVSVRQLNNLPCNNPFILQISAHGYFDSTLMKPALLLNDSEIVTHNGIENMSSSPLLACLIMCESGRGVIKLYEGSDNLGRSFAANGTPAVITSLWKADDKASALIMSSFYRFLSEGLPVHEALAAAKREFRANNPDMIHPFYWAALQSTGDNLTIPLKSVQQKNNRLIYFIIAGAVLISGVVLFLFIQRRNKAKN